MFLVLLTLLIYLSICLAGIVITWRLATKRKVRILNRLLLMVALAFVTWAIPFGDQTWGRFVFRGLCEREAGLKVYQVRAGVEGFRSVYGEDKSYWMAGYRFVEVPYSGSLVTRYARRDDGGIEMMRGVNPIGRYALEEFVTMVGAQISRTERYIIDTQTKEKLATHLSFGHQGGWLNRQLEAMHPSRPSCPAKPFDPNELLMTVIPPAKKGS